MTAAQARNNSRSVMYSSSSLSDKTRNQLFIFAIVATVIGALLFRMSDIGSMTILSKRQLVPVPVKDNSIR